MKKGSPVVYQKPSISHLLKSKLLSSWFLRSSNFSSLQYNYHQHIKACYHLKNKSKQCSYLTIHTWPISNSFAPLSNKVPRKRCLYWLLPIILFLFIPKSNPFMSSKFLPFKNAQKWRTLRKFINNHHVAKSSVSDLSSFICPTALLETFADVIPFSRCGVQDTTLLVFCLTDQSISVSVISFLCVQRLILE